MDEREVATDGDGVALMDGKEGEGDKIETGSNKEKQHGKVGKDGVVERQLRQRKGKKGDSKVAISPAKDVADKGSLDDEDGRKIDNPSQLEGSTAPHRRSKRLARVDTQLTERPTRAAKKGRDNSSQATGKGRK